MQLRAYLLNHRRSARDLAIAVGCSEARISQILAGGDVSADLARRIHAASGGLVTPNDLMGVACDCGGVDAGGEAGVTGVSQEAGEVQAGEDLAGVDDVVGHGAGSTPGPGRRMREVLP